MVSLVGHSDLMAVRGSGDQVIDLCPNVSVKDLDSIMEFVVPRYKVSKDEIEMTRPCNLNQRLIHGDFQQPGLEAIE